MPRNAPSWVRAGAPFAACVAFLLAALPSGYALKRGGPCGELLCACPAERAAPAPERPSCCAEVRLVADPGNAASVDVQHGRWALQEALGACVNQPQAAVSPSDAQAEPRVLDRCAEDRSMPCVEIPTPPPRA